MGDEPVIGRAIGAGRPQLFDWVHGAVVALAGLDLIQGRGGQAATAADSELRDAQRIAQKAVDARRKAEQDAQRLAGRASAYRAQEIAPREAAQAHARAAESEARARLEAVKARRQELVQIAELEKKAVASSQGADSAEKAWAAAEGDAQEHRHRTAKHLSQIFADIAIPMAPDKIRSAGIGGGRCPDCRKQARRVHSTYQRILDERPLGPRQVVVRLRVRRYVCDRKSCARKTFVEQVPGLSERHCRSSTGLAAVDRDRARRTSGRPAVPASADDRGPDSAAP
ncbi:hypothetical protein FB563_8214 [Streptomyces puniciscabiei]|uniref:Transposase IS204/IS1001/IS1096/IS1165 family protein n=1 Tax=Streptomyces puniciscabiei TaxID=164348 RepID=A0A542SX89_9ACTN|nr:hypothetical protein [Streptomyces puniciscabiei]TQK79222.1 hypothetical protein FB563_8214 [Streptomyces puniciscabiei]